MTAEKGLPMSISYTAHGRGWRDLAWEMAAREEPLPPRDREQSTPPERESVTLTRPRAAGS